VDRANAYEILPGHILNGQLELGEILGDLNGLHIAHRANVRNAESRGLDLEQANREFLRRRQRSIASIFVNRPC